jgi:hypothetical protein
VRNQEDIDYLFKAILPDAISKSIQKIFLRKHGEISEEKIKNALEKALLEIDFGVMVETTDILKNSGNPAAPNMLELDAILTMRFPRGEAVEGLRYPPEKPFVGFVSVGTNDLTLAILEEIDKVPAGTYNRDMAICNLGLDECFQSF